MSDLEQLREERPLAKRMLWKLAKIAIRSVPVIGSAYELVDEVVLGSLAEERQEQVNEMVSLMYEKLGPLMEQLSEATDEELERRAGEPEVGRAMSEFRQEVERRQERFEGMFRDLLAKVGENHEKIETLTAEVAELGKTLEVGAQFKYIARCVKHRIALQGSVRELYDVMEKIGEAGQGALFRAHRKGTPKEERVVVKMLKKANDPKAVQRFLLEGFLSSQIVHEGIVRVSDYGGFFGEGEYFIEMEDLGGENLKEWAKAHPFQGDNLESYVGLLLQGVDALSHIHRKNLVHRDLKPSNFMVVGDRLKLIDFGSVKSLEVEESLRAGRTMTSTGEMVGTPQYMAPEQFDRSFAKIAPATDVYGFGVTMFEVLTGQLPFYATSAIQYGKAHTELQPPRLSEVNEKVPGWLNALVLHAMAKRPEMRVKMETMRECLEQNRPEASEKMMEEVNRLLMKSVSSGLSAEAEKSVRVSLETMEKRMAGASEQLRRKLKEFVVETEKALAGFHKREQAKVSRAFNPLLCPNMMCETVLQEGKECPDCKTSWMMPCVCERKRETPYRKEVCQQCRERRPITMEEKRRHSLRVTVKRCLEEKKYVQAISFFGFFPELQSDPEVKGMYEEAMGLQRKAEKEKLQAVESRVKTGIRSFEEEQKKEVQERKKQEEAEREKERKRHLGAMERMMEGGELNEAMDYYEERFPKELKNEKTQEARDRAWDQLVRDELEEAVSMAKKREYGKALKTLAAMSEERPTAKFREAVEGVCLAFGKELYQEGHYQKAIEVWQYGEKVLRGSPKMQEKAMELHRKFQALVNGLNEAERLLEEMRRRGWGQEGEMAQVEERLQQEMFFEPVPSEVEERHIALSLSMRACQRLEVATRRFGEGDLYQAENVLEEELFCAPLPEWVMERQWALAGKIETERRKQSGMMGKMRYLSRREEKEREDYEKAKEACQERKRRKGKKEIGRGEYGRIRKEFVEAIAERKRKEEERERVLKIIPAFDKICQSGFTFVKEATYTCGPYRSTVQEFRHERTGMEFVYLPGGTFQMGGNQYDSEKPIHKVTLSPYLIAKYECTQAEWQKVMGSNPSNFKGDRRPVEQVSWDDCQQFCQKAGLSLPTEAQWEFACRAGSPGEYCFGDNESLGEYAWYDKNSGNQTHPVGEKKPNAFGLFDMHGNVWEWCQDWYENYESGNAVDPKGPSSGSARVFRGGCWDDNASHVRCAGRGCNSPGNRSDYLGFRCALAPQKK